MFSSIVNLYDVPPAPTWWQTDCVKYGLSYTPVRSRLTSLIGNHVVRLTDRKYMTQLALKLQEDYEAWQNIRIEQRKLKATWIVPELRELSLLKKMTRRHRRRRRCTPSIPYVEVAKKCKQLSRFLLADDS